jgi:beta-barrel assembly-enhancing protease
MTRQVHRSRIRVLLASVATVTMTLSAAAQTRIEPHSNRYSPAQDVELGRQAAAQVRQQLPMVNDGPTNDFIDRIGERLVEEIPDELAQPAFRYTFDVVNLREINAFALPGGPMFLHRGMLEAARTDGEVAGVMAHELSHVILRHGTAQATKGQKFQIGAIAGQVLGSIVGGRTGNVIAQGSQIGLGTYFMKYSREYEREADLLGAQIMARAGYDPREMANMFQTIARRGGGGGPEWLSDHPNPANRYEAINREAAMLRVDRSSGSNAEIRSVQTRLARLAPAPTTEQVVRARQGQRRDADGVGGRAVRVAPPSGRWRTYQLWDFLSLTVPSNWRQIDGRSAVTYAPDGGYVQAQSGQSAFSHGIEIGVMRGDGGSLQQSTEELLQGFARANPQLRRQGGYSRTRIDGRQALTTTLSNVSDVTGDTEVVSLSTAQLRDGRVLFLIGVAPQDETRTYLDTFGRVRQSLQIEESGTLRNE